mmetsp:Transcript_79173/g.228977  ORF Transcript_79173/g.228977 Transcript_79173/m.228977 type:complete len:250 (-) Transcript_79173:320-1069(-)
MPGTSAKGPRWRPWSVHRRRWTSATCSPTRASAGPPRLATRTDVASRRLCGREGSKARGRKQARARPRAPPRSWHRPSARPCPTPTPTTMRSSHLGSWPRASPAATCPSGRGAQHAEGGRRRRHRRSRKFLRRSRDKAASTTSDARGCRRSQGQSPTRPWRVCPEACPTRRAVHERRRAPRRMSRRPRTALPPRPATCPCAPAPVPRRPMSSAWCMATKTSRHGDPAAPGGRGWPRGSRALRRGSRTPG